jgi:hypothetical protein
MLPYDQLVRHLPVLFTAAFVAVLFIQSGLDKVFDRKGNVEWLTGHFSKTILAGMVPLMLTTITVLEIVTGMLSAIGAVYLLFTGSAVVIFLASIFGAASLTALFFGQRVAKDYAGAAVLVPYFILLLIMMGLSSPLAHR